MRGRDCLAARIAHDASHCPEGLASIPSVSALRRGCQPGVALKRHDGRGSLAAVLRHSASPAPEVDSMSRSAERENVLLFAPGRTPDDKRAVGTYQHYANDFGKPIASSASPLKGGEAVEAIGEMASTASCADNEACEASPMLM